MIDILIFAAVLLTLAVICLGLGSIRQERRITYLDIHLKTALRWCNALQVKVDEIERRVK